MLLLCLLRGGLQRFLNGLVMVLQRFLDGIVMVLQRFLDGLVMVLDGFRNLFRSTAFVLCQDHQKPSVLLRTTKTSRSFSGPPKTIGPSQDRHILPKGNSPEKASLQIV